MFHGRIQSTVGGEIFRSASLHLDFFYSNDECHNSTKERQWHQAEQTVNCETIDFGLPNHAAESQLYTEVLAEVWSGLIDTYYKQL